MANKDKEHPPQEPLVGSSGFGPDDVAKGGTGTPRALDTKSAKPSPESDQMQRDQDRSRALQVGLGGPFSKARIDPTETDDALTERGAGPKAAAKTDLRGAGKNMRLVGVKAPGTYRRGVRVPGGIIVEVPKDEPTARWMDEDVDQNSVPIMTLPPLPELSKEDKEQAELQRRRQEMARNTAATIAALDITKPTR